MPLAALKLTVKRKVAGAPVPSATLGLSIDTVGASSSSVMVPVPAASPRVALTGALKAMAMVSSASSAASPVTETSKVCVVVPAAKVSVPAVMAV